MTRNPINAPLKAIGYAIAVLTLCGCTARQAYEGLQQHARNECITLPLSQQSDCLAQASISFDEYQRLRKEAIMN
jgi:hypothetical protein